MTRFRDYETQLCQFEQEVWVRCPRCEATGSQSRPVLSRRIDSGTTWRIACFHCGYTKTASRADRKRQLPWWSGENWWEEFRKYNGAVDPLFGLPLWLQVPCCGEVLWAYNAAHLDWLDRYIRATIRERQGGKGNHHSIAVRLPRWMKLARNRTPLLKGIQQLRHTLQTLEPI